MVILLAVGVTYFAYAADPMMRGRGMMDGNDMMHRGMMDQGMMGKGMPIMCPMHMMMCQGVVQKQVVATSDGGAIVVVDNKMLKYDKDLNLVKEAELKIDVNEMKAKMQQMMKECAEKCQTIKP